MKKQRIQKIMASFGFCSRRKAEELIKAGRVKHNNITANLGDLAHTTDKIYVDDILLHNKNNEKIYIALNKPRGYICSMSDEKNRKTVCDLIKDIKKRVYPVGRLDLTSEGLLILTNDGSFANNIMHPKNKIDKIYKVVIKKSITKEQIDQLESGIYLDGKKTAKCNINILQNKKNHAVLMFKIHEGKKRQIRKMIDSVLHTEVTRLQRIQIGNIKLSGLGVGEYRSLKNFEIDFFK